MAKNISTKIILRNDTLANWTQKNPVLDAGEVAVITDQYTFKIGDGSSTFTALPQIRAIAADVNEWAKKNGVVDVVISGYSKSDATGALTAEDTIAIALSKIENNITAVANAATKVTANDKNGYITVDGKDVKVYELKVDGVTITAADDGTIGVGTIGMDKVDGLTKKLQDMEDAVPEYTIEKAADSGEYSAVYNLKKDGVVVGVPINIPKDMVVQSGSVVTDADDNHKGTYLKLVLANAANDTIWIPVDSLIEYVTSGSASGDMVVIDVSADHKVTATITDGTVTKAKLHTDVQAVLDDVANKVDKVEGKQLSTNDFTNEYKDKLDGVSTGANKVEESSTNGNIKIDGEEKTVYTLPETVVQTTDILILNCGNASGVV